MPLSREAHLPCAVAAVRRDPHERWLRAVEAERVGQQVLEQRAQQRFVTEDARQLPGHDPRAGLLDRLAEGVFGAPASTSRERDRPALAALAADAREREQVVDQRLHALGAVDGEVDVLVGALVELPAVARLERLAEARDLPQRLLEIVRGHIGELLEVGVRAGQLERLALDAARARRRPRPARARSARASPRSPPSARAPRAGRPGSASGAWNSPAATRRAA